MEEFLYDCECRHLAKGTLRNYGAQINFLVEYLESIGIVDVEDVKSVHIRNFLRMKQEQGCKPTYINDLLKAQKTMFNYLEEEEYIANNAAARVKNVKQPKVVIESFTEEEVRAMLNYYAETDYRSVRNKAIIALLFDTGVRCNEMIMMEPEDVGVDYILVKHGKGSKERIVPKSSYLGKQLMRYERVRNGYFGEKVLKYNNLFLITRGKPLTGEVVARMADDYCSKCRSKWTGRSSCAGDGGRA